jgi:hypothetical protein|tara:strand:- start:1030 stop:1317 length:288 start_codon:yes stop_codon:yes gene_type:complete
MTDDYKMSLKIALKDLEVTVNVGDAGENYDDLENSRDIAKVIEACEATDSPVVTFFKNGVSQGYMIVLVGHGDESIADYSVSEFMTRIVGESLIE